MAPHSSTLAWQFPWVEEPGGLWSMGVTKSRTWLSDFPFTFHFHALEKEMATHSSVLAWRIPGTREPVGLPSMGSHRVGHDWSDLAAAAAAPYFRELKQHIFASLASEYGLQATLVSSTACPHTNLVLALHSTIMPMNYVHCWLYTTLHMLSLTAV